MKFDFHKIKSAYTQTIEDFVNQQTNSYKDSFLSFWKDKWVALLHEYGWHHGKVIDCSFGYNFQSNVIDMNVTLLLPNEEEVTLNEVEEVIELTEKQKMFMDMKNLLMIHLASADDQGLSEQIKDLLFQFGPSDIKNENNN
jgi:hypothetical protein